MAFILLKDTEGKQRLVNTDKIIQATAQYGETRIFLDGGMDSFDITHNLEILQAFLNSAVATVEEPTKYGK